MKKKTKISVISSAMLLALVGLAGCNGGGNSDVPQAPWYSNYQGLGFDSSDDMQELVLGDYDAKYRAAAAITDPTQKRERFEAFAEAEYDLIFDSAIIIPWLSQNGSACTVSKTVPWQAGRATYGLTSDKFKNVVATTGNITQEQRAKVTADYEAHKTDPVPSHELPDGWTSLDNDHPNGTIDENGKYWIDKGGSNEVSFQTATVYKTTYTKEYEKSLLNYLTNTWTYNSYHYCNMVDGLVENDKYGNIVGALADKYKITDEADGSQTWTFHLKETNWVNNATGNVVAPVKASDFVASAKYVLDPLNASGTANLYTGFISGADEYFTLMSDEDTRALADWSTVGVVANDEDRTITYKLPEATPYFMTVLTYSPFLPVNPTFLEAEGANFGKDENHILVNGAFRITEHEPNSYMLYTKNASYFDASHVYVNQVRRQFVAAEKTSKDIRQMFEAGTIDGFTVNEKNDPEGWQKYVTVNGGTRSNPGNPVCNVSQSYGSTTYIGYYNFNRSFWDTHEAGNVKTTAAKKATAIALLNKTFRQAFLYGLDVSQELALYSPADPCSWLMRGYTNRELDSADGIDYADYVDEAYKAHNGITDPNFSLTGIDNTKDAAGKCTDPILNPTLSSLLFAKAKNELHAAGLTNADFPIKIDVIGNMDIEVRALEDLMYKTIETASNGLVKIQVNVPATDDEDTGWGSVYNNYDFSMWSGWGPDYADPNTYLHTMCIGGDMVEQLGF